MFLATAKNSQLLTSVLSVGTSLLWLVPTNDPKLVLMRPYSGPPGMLKSYTKTELRQMQHDLEGERAEFIEMMEAMPRELLLVLRNQNYMRFLNAGSFHD